MTAIALALLLLTAAAGCAAVGVLAAIVYVIRHHVHVGRLLENQASRHVAKCLIKQMKTNSVKSFIGKFIKPAAEHTVKTTFSSIRKL